MNTESGSMAWAWTALAVAIIFEVVGTLLLRKSEGFTRMLPAGGALLAYWACFAFAGIAMRSIPLAVVYAIWAGVGIALVTAIAVFWLGESMNPLKIVFIGMILAGATGLHLVSAPR